MTDAAAALARVSAIFGVHVVRYVVVGVVRPVHLLELADGRAVKLGRARHVLRQSRVRAVIHAATLRAFPALSEQRWAGVVADLAAAQERLPSRAEGLLREAFRRLTP